VRRPFTVGIDAGPMLGVGGISGYVGPLVHHLLAGNNAEYRLLLRRPWRHLAQAAELAQLAPLHRQPLPDRLIEGLWSHALPCPWPSPFWRGLDLYLSTSLFTPHWPQGRVISILYDTIPLRLPHLFPDHAAFAAQLRRVVDRSDHIVTISHTSRRDLIELMAVPPDSISVVYPGQDAHFRPQSEAERAAVVQRYVPEGPYFLYVGALGGHKNVGTLLAAFAEARRAGARERLLLVGSHRWGGELLAQLAQSPQRDAVLLPGFVPDEDLPPLYAGATAFIFPSLYEGFGMPVLEAMGCGAPVITTHGGALPEAAGDAALLVDPLDSAAMAQAMLLLAGSDARRQRCRELGWQQAARFDWAASARQLRAILQHVAE